MYMVFACLRAALNCESEDAMNVRNCKKCGKIFNYITGQPLCASCREVYEAKFQEVKKFVQENKGATVQQVSQECEVEEAQIRQWVREERLIFAEGSFSGIACEKCGIGITAGRFCARCKSEMINTLAAAGRRASQPQQEPAGRRTNDNRMRFINN